MENSNSWEYFPIELPDELKEKAILLYETLGVHDIAWEYEDVVQVLEYLYSESVLILGGDVLFRKLEGYKFIGDNWSNDSSDIEKGYHASLQYIKEYYRSRGNSYVYTLICEIGDK